MKDYLKVTYRDVARMLCQALPFADEELGDRIAEHTEVIKGMSTEAKLALKCAYVFSRKVPREEREDLFQELALALLEAKAPSEKLAYTIARCDWQNWWQKYKTRQHLSAGSLNAMVSDVEGHEVELGELLVGEVEFETKMNGRLDAERIWNKLPEAIKTLVQKRLLGKGLNASEGMQLLRFARAHSEVLC